MPWYWTDDFAPVLLADGAISDEVASALVRSPVAYRSDSEAVEEAVRELMEDGEIPLAA